MVSWGACVVTWDVFYSNNYVIFTYILLKFDSKRIYLADTFVLSFRTKFGVDIFQQVHGSSQHSVDIGMHMFNHLVCGNTKGLTTDQGILKIIREMLSNDMSLGSPG